MKDIDEVIRELREDERSGKAQEMEQHFRRGYHHGAEIALTGVLALMRLGISSDDIVAMCNLFEGDIEAWRRGELTEAPEFNPGLYEKKLQETKATENAECDDQSV